MTDEAEFDPNKDFSFSDVAADNPISPKIIPLQIKHSKIDQEWVGVKVFLGRTGDDLCPVNALMDYLHRCWSTLGVCSNGRMVFHYP